MVVELGGEEILPPFILLQTHQFGYDKERLIGTTAPFVVEIVMLVYAVLYGFYSVILPRSRRGDGTRRCEEWKPIVGLAAEDRGTGKCLDILPK